MSGLTLNARYRVDADLGQGGMGAVYRAFDLALNRPVALKMLNAQGLGTEGRARLLAEARAAAQLNHPNIVAIYDVGETDKSPFIVMELVEGQTLRAYPPVSLDETLSIARQICSALDHAHTAGIIHRDLKPENVILTKAQTAKLADFGLARTIDSPQLTEEGALVGTFAYLAPELIQGQPATVQSDLYALGVMLYELIAHRPPFAGDTLMAVLSQHLTAPVTPLGEHNPAVPAWLDDLILRLLSKHPDERPPTTRDVLRLFEQAVAPAPATRGTLLPKNNLPADRNVFIGREKEIAQLKQRLSEHQLVTLTGSGGVGKTRLAIQTARESVLDYGNGAWLVELASLANPDLVPGAVAMVLGVRGESDQPIIAALTDYLRDKTLLLVLDNCEHVIEAGAHLAEHLLRHCPDLRILASSREALGVTGEAAVRVPSLSLPPTERFSREALEHSEAVQLFVTRAAAALPGFELTETNAPAIVQVCHRLDGMALAIELAAARVKLLKVEQIATRLDDAFRLLTGGSRTALPRQQTLRATIDWSYNLLSEMERQVLRRLSVFAGSWTLEAAEVICSGEGVEGYDVLDILTSLANKSLVVTEREPGEDARYHLLETTRQYAREKLLESGEGEAVRGRHFDFYLGVGEAAKSKLRSAGWLLWQSRLKDDWDNFRTALDWSFANAQTREPEKSLRLAIVFAWMLPVNARSWPEVFGWIRKGLVYLTDQDDQTKLLRAEALYTAAWQGRFFYLGYVMAEESVALYRANPLTDKRDLAWALATYSSTGFLERKIDRAQDEALAAECVALCRALGPSGYWELAFAILGVAETAAAYEAYETAWTRGQESKALYEQTGDRVNAAYCLMFLGLIAQAQGDYPIAHSYCEESLYLTQQAAVLLPEAVQVDILNCKWQLARLDRVIGNYDAAHQHLEEVLSAAQEAGSRMYVSGALRELGRIALARGNPGLATRLLRECLLASQEVKDVGHKAVGLATLSDVWRVQGHSLQAARLLGTAEPWKTTLPPIPKMDYIQSLEATRAALSEEAFARAYAEGQAMTIEQAIEYALEISAAE